MIYNVFITLSRVAEETGPMTPDNLTDLSGKVLNPAVFNRKMRNISSHSAFRYRSAFFISERKWIFKEVKSNEQKLFHLRVSNRRTS